MLERIGIGLEDSKRERYSPVKFDEKGLVPPEFCNVHQDPPLILSFYGVVAYTIDQLVARNILGKTREECVKKMLERRLNGMDKRWFEAENDE